MSIEKEPIGVLYMHRPLGTYRAVCTFKSCGWTWTGDRAQAEKTLRSHASQQHPQPIHIYRNVDENGGDQ